MRSRRLDYEVTNAVLAWAIVGVLGVATAWSTLAGAPLTAGVAAAVVAVAVVPPVLARDPSRTVPWEVLALAALPVAALATGVVDASAAFLAVAVLALVVAVELDAFTTVEMTPDFAVAFVVVVTMAVAGLWAIAAFAADALLGTSLLAGLNALMWELILATVVGVVTGLVFEVYVRRHSPGRALARERSGGRG